MSVKTLMVLAVMTYPAKVAAIGSTPPDDTAIEPEGPFTMGSSRDSRGRG